MKLKQSRDNLLNSVSLLGICLWFSVPLVSGVTGIKAVVVLVALWGLSARPRALGNSVVSNMWLIFWYAYMCLLLVLGVWTYGQMEPLGFFPGVALFGLGSVFTKYYEMNGNSALVSRAFIVTIIGWAVGALISIVQLIRYPLASRMLATGEQTDVDYSALGIGGFGFVYGSILVVVGLIYLLRTKLRHRAGLKPILILALAAIVAFVIASQYATALLLLGLAGGVALIAPRSRRALWATLAAAALTAFLLIGHVGRLLTRLAESLPEEAVARDKILDVARGFGGGGFGDQSAHRVELYARSFQEFLKSPLFGQTTSQLPGDLGGHSAWIDLLGAFGAVGSFPLLFFLLSQAWRRVHRSGQSLFGSTLIIAYLYVIVLGFINPVIYLPQIGFALFFMVPAASIITAGSGDDSRKIETGLFRFEGQLVSGDGRRGSRERRLRVLPLSS